jgi:hypothetical protein
LYRSQTSLGEFKHFSCHQFTTRAVQRTRAICCLFK